MGMGYQGCYADEISTENILKLDDEEKSLQALMYKFSKQVDKDGDLDSFANEVQYGEMEEEYAESYKLLEELQKQFEKITGLVLYISYHNSEENGSRYDEVEGAFWEVGNITQPTKEALAARKKGVNLKRKFYVTYG